MRASRPTDGPAPPELDAPADGPAPSELDARADGPAPPELDAPSHDILSSLTRYRIGSPVRRARCVHVSSSVRAADG